MPPPILITGAPGVGKTTIIRNLCVEFQNREIPFGGFYTEEVRNNEGQRCGFDIVTFDGKRGPLARVSGKTSNATGNNFVGKYAVNVTEFESIALAALNNRSTRRLLLIDEIGKMELKSRLFEENLQQIRNSVIRGELVLVASIPLKGTLNIVEQLKKIPNVHLFHVTLSNRNLIQRDILEAIVRTLGD